MMVGGPVFAERLVIVQPNIAGRLDLNGKTLKVDIINLQDWAHPVYRSAYSSIPNAAVGNIPGNLDRVNYLIEARVFVNGRVYTSRSLFVPAGRGTLTYRLNLRTFVAMRSDKKEAVQLAAAGDGDYVDGLMEGTPELFLELIPEPSSDFQPFVEEVEQPAVPMSMEAPANEVPVAPQFMPMQIQMP
jgi:hypothetical protein